ncbi:hypothetical protein FGO68_gene1179 [Halteria grandinella]|uniref:Uncharacterized protein n=1 Tax=Halteria grandinella TaxID=5974 RepID=A0A8J8ND75_HALGN|nr:hypothetical protein FGO68_gene1179 [Halteria grandinella]
MSLRKSILSRQVSSKSLEKAIRLVNCSFKSTSWAALSWMKTSSLASIRSSRSTLSCNFSCSPKTQEKISIDTLKRLKDSC